MVLLGAVYRSELSVKNVVMRAGVGVGVGNKTKTKTHLFIYLFIFNFFFFFGGGVNGWRRM